MKFFTLFIVACSLPLIALKADELTVYFGTSKDGGILRSTFNQSTGHLTKPKKVAEINRAGFIALHPNKQYLYATTGKIKDWKRNGGVTAFEIQTDQSLKQLNQQTTHGRGACFVSVDATGHMVLAANYGGGNIAAFQINSNGSLTPTTSAHKHKGQGAHEHRQNTPHPHSIYPNPSNTFAYVPDLGTDQIVVYALNTQTATLAPTTSIEIPGGAQGPRHMKFSRDGKHAYVLNELSLTVSHLTSSSDTSNTGVLKHLSQTSTLEENTDTTKITASEIRIHPNNQFLYSANRDLTGNNRDSISHFKILKDGTPRFVKTTPAQVDIPRNFNISPNGKWMLVGGQNSKNVAIFAIDQETGILTFTKQLVEFPAGPICIEFL